MNQHPTSRNDTMPTFTLDAVCDQPSESLQPIHSRLAGHDRAQLPDRDADESCRLPVFAGDDKGTIIGGIVGELFCDWLHVTTLWVHESCRKQRVGSLLTSALEVLSVERATFHNHLETTTFRPWASIGNTVARYLANGKVGQPVTHGTT